jgi:hypothetical protein
MEGVADADPAAITAFFDVGREGGLGRGVRGCGGGGGRWCGRRLWRGWAAAAGGDAEGEGGGGEDEAGRRRPALRSGMLLPCPIWW